MAQSRVHYRPYNHADKSTVAAKLEFCDASGKVVQYTKSAGPEDYVIATFPDVRDETALRVKCATKGWRLACDPCYIPCLKDCKCEIALIKAEIEQIIEAVEESRATLKVELEWCETIDGEHHRFGPASASALNIRDWEGDWKDSKPVSHGKAQFQVACGCWYTLDSPGIVMCPGPPSIFVCGEEEICLKICCRPPHVIEVTFQDQCGSRLPHTEGLIDGRRVKADEHGRLWHACPGDATVSVQPRGDQWTFNAIAIDPAGSARKALAITCYRVPQPRKPTWIVLDVEIEDPASVFAYLEPVGEHKGEQPVVLSLDASGHAQTDFGKPATFILRLTDKATGHLVYTDVVQTEILPVAPPVSAMPPQLPPAPMPLRIGE
jgi:hypothetical protein